jgi:plasmid stabilization system protein ParE
MRDLAEIAGYIAQDSEQIAWLVETRIHEAARLLVTIPAMGRPGRVDGSRELVVPRTPYILVYRISAGTIRILRILRGARCWPSRFE